MKKIYPLALEVGIKPSDFWENSISENTEIIKALNKRNFENIYELSALIRVAVVSAFNADVKFPELNTEKEEQSNLNDWESSKAYMMKLQERRKNK